jgi:hypothetical protein
VRHLEAVVDHPALRPDGTVLITPGYDATTGLLLDMAGKAPAVPASPTKAQAEAARELLLNVVCDFPFEHPAHRAAWLGALLTPLARFAFSGPAPLFLVDANVRAAGKGLLLHTLSLILTGEEFTIATYTGDQDELRKRITSLAMSGDRLVLFDNLEGKFGNAVLDAALTATSWEDRILGVNRTVRVPLFITWYATGNNVIVGADTSRRVCPIRLESPDERPEDRTGFKNPDLLAYVKANRPRLLGAALTILRAYCAAGRPEQKLTPWGSFGGWSSLVRGAVVWVGLPDPREACRMFQAQADVAAEGMGQLLVYWQRMDPDGRGLTASEVIDTLFRNPPKPAPDWHADMKAAVESLIGRGDSRLLGYKLRAYRRRVFQGCFIDKVGKDHQAARWAVYPESVFRRPPGNPPHPPRRVEPGEDGEDSPSPPGKTSADGLEEFTV